MAAEPAYAELHCHSAYSFLDGASHPEELVDRAVRLGLASVVTERHGAGGAGFLILDECFGSQDPARRGSILNALRGLKQTPGQIFLISHVGGLEDAAGAVIEVDLDDEANAVAVRA